jgi:sugar phosphate isomerase/epimerase
MVAGVSSGVMQASRVTWGYVVTAGFESWKPEEIISTLSHLGYHTIEWTLDHFNPRRRSTTELKEMVRLAGNKGLVGTQVAAFIDFVSGDEDVRQDKLRLAIETIRAASESGVSLVSIYAGPNSWDPRAPQIPTELSTADAWGRLFSSLDVLYPIAEAEGLTLCFKPCVGSLAYDYFSTLPVIQQYGQSESFGINFDPSHLVLYGNDLAWAVSEYADLIRHVHLKDVFGIPGDEGRHFMFPMLGEGVTDWSSLYSELKNQNYCGSVSIIFEAFAYLNNVLDQDPVAAARLSLEQAQKLPGFRSEM